MSRVLMLHGFLGSPQSFDTLGRLLAVPYFAPTLLGHRGSDVTDGHTAPYAGNPRRGTDFIGEVDWIADWCRDHGWDRGHVLGYSMGARLALGLLLRHPALCSSATLIGVHPGLRDVETRQARLQLDRARARALRQGGLDAFVTAWEHEPLFASQTDLPPESWSFQARQRRSHDPEGLAHALDCCGLSVMPNLEPELPNLTSAVQLITGEVDGKFGTIADRLARKLASAVHVRVPGTGHNPVLEAPEFVASAVGSFLQGSVHE